MRMPGSVSPRPARTSTSSAAIGEDQRDSSAHSDARPKRSRHASQTRARYACELLNVFLKNSPIVLPLNLAPSKIV